ncbi:MAG: hypothetical protein DMG83_11975 [Acidobacteria bacterium]|nr:MAG: hypothetical protein DMG83_11975 [Acidobacteriota bacterium]
MTLKRSQVAAVAAVALLSATPSWALETTGRSLANDWTWPPFIVISLVLTATLYGIGVTRMRRRTAHRRSLLWRILWFVLGWISLVIALDSPLHELGEQLFWVHMTQHEILMLISAPLLVLGRPLVAFLWALAPSWRDRAPVSAWLLSALALWTWHIPWLFDQTLRSNWIHAAQHTTFLVTAIIFWWPLANRISTIGYGGGLAYVFTTILHTSVLGALLTFAPRPWYSSYITTAPAWGLTALEDQQLGGLIMWIPAGTLLLIVALFLLVKWMNESQTRWQYTRMAELGRLSERGLK